MIPTPAGILTARGPNSKLPALSLEREYGPAAQAYGKAFQLEPTKARPHNLMGLLYVNQQQTDLARKEYQAAARIAPTKARALILLGHLDESIKNPPQHDGEFAVVLRAYTPGIKAEILTGTYPVFASPSAEPYTVRVEFTQRCA